jgi:UDP-N-acetylglucosamine:LPS N-acetylglucosamine transferase
MDYAYAVADLVVARAGAISVSELCLVQKPAILVPLAHGRRGSSNPQCARFDRSRCCRAGA